MKNKIAPRLISIEMSLNAMEYCGVPIGGLLSSYNYHYQYLGLKNPIFIKSLASFIKFSLKGFLIPQASRFKNRSILLSRSGNANHFKRMIDPLKMSLSTDAILYAPDELSDFENYIHSHHLNLSRYRKVFSFVFHNIKKVNLEYSQSGRPVNKFHLFFFLFIQLVRVENWIEFFTLNEVQKVVVDFDRDMKNAPIILSANKMNIKTITLTHGVINPPYGYNPLLAHEIWLWGSFQISQLMSLGVQKSRMKIVGNPIAELSSQIRRDEIENRPTIGIALNTTGTEVTNKILTTVLNPSPNMKKLDWIIKLHPSMKKTNEIRQFENDNVKLFDNKEVSKDVFFKTCDIIVVGNSGIGYEAILNGVPVFVVKEKPDSKENDDVMITYGNCPEIKDKESFQKILNQVITDPKTYIKDLIQKEQKFVHNELYQFIGNDAINNILNSIELN